MSRHLSYSDNTSGSDWSRRDPYTDDDIAKITDPSGSLNERPRTAIPSPLARVDLVKNAFRTLAADKRLRGAVMHRRLVSDALDVMQLMFNLPAHSPAVRIVRWSAPERLANLAREPEHAGIAHALGVFLRADSEAYNFADADDWYILMLDNRPIGSTSPATLAMGAPDAAPQPSIMLEEGVELFNVRTRDLHERDTDFIVWLVRYLNAMPTLRRRMPELYDYVLANLDILRSSRPDAYAEVTAAVPNPAAFTPDTRDGSALMAADYDEYTLTPGLRVLGMPVYCRRPDDALRHVAHSDFMLRPRRKQPEGESMPLVLAEGLQTPGTRPYRYITRPWDPTTRVRTGSLPPEERTLPGTSEVYPWLGVADLLEPVLIELSSSIDAAHWLDPTASAKSGDNGFLIPVRPLFFRYFDAEFLRADVAPGKRVLEMIPSPDGMAVTLRIPVAGGYIELCRTYRRTPAGAFTADDAGLTGAILPPVPVSVSVFPFVRTGSSDMYNVQLLELCRDYKPHIEFYAGSPGPLRQRRAPVRRTRFRIGSSEYHEIDSAIDAIRVTLAAPDGSEAAAGIALPVWPDYRPSATPFTFAVDFGTTNTHIEYAEGDNPPQPLAFQESSEATLVATLARKGSMAQFESVMELEFIPRSIDGFYSFPLRTVLAENEDNDARPEALRTANISFAYERKEFSRYRVHTNLKWGSDPILTEQFLREVVMLLRARVLASGGNPALARVIYFYPVSMKRSLQNRYFTLWEQLADKYLGGHAPGRITACPESSAPAFHYADAATTGADFVSVDIGGGTTDVVVYRADADGMSSRQSAIASFRFAGNTIFGDGFVYADARNNPLVAEYSAYFSRAVTEDPDLAYLDVILGGITASGRSEDINAFLFSIEHSPALRDLPAIDRRRFSYNSLLADDPARKLIFVYFFSAIIYYVATMLRESGAPMPKQIFFSGTGSKILGIVGRHDTVERLARLIIERVYGTPYSSVHFTLKTDIEAPKEVTCKGGVELLRRLDTRGADAEAITPEGIARCKTAFSPGAPESGYTYRSVRDPEARKDIADAARRFHAFLRELLSRELRDELGVPQEVFDFFSAHADDDIDNYLSGGIEARLPIDEGADEAVEDVPFFYPLAGVIRNTLVPNLTQVNLKTRNTHL